MTWKNLPTSIKGIIWGFLAFIIFHLIGFVITTFSYGTSLVSYILVTFSPNEKFTLYSYVLLAIFLIVGFIVGLIVGKIKSKK